MVGSVPPSPFLEASREGTKVKGFTSQAPTDTVLHKAKGRITLPNPQGMWVVRLVERLTFDFG